MFKELSSKDFSKTANKYKFIIIVHICESQDNYTVCGRGNKIEAIKKGYDHLNGSSI
jgi:hypothetical protein